MGLLSVAEARAHILADVLRLDVETVPLSEALGRTVGAALTARRTQPPFRASAMDGYALRAIDAATVGSTLRVIGEAPAGRAFTGVVGPGETVRIFTGAPVPDGADTVLIQENAAVIDAVTISVSEPAEPGRHIRPAGLDFTNGEPLVADGSCIDWRSLSLLAAMDHPTVPVVRRPRIAILATGDELVRPGQPMRADQIVASNSFGLAAFVSREGGEPIDLGIARDDRRALIDTIGTALTAAPDVLVTLGGASVGDHDLVRETLGQLGLDLDFWKVAMRPGKPLMFGRRGSTRVLGLPGNPVSSLVGAVLYLGPLIRALLGQSITGLPRRHVARLGGPLKANDSRADFLRAKLSEGADGLPIATAHDTQDSSMLRRFVDSDCLIEREPFADAAPAGSLVRVIPL